MISLVAVFRPVTGLHPRAVALLWVLHEWRGWPGWPPSFEQLKMLVGLKSTDTVWYWLDQLEQRGLVMRDKRTARGAVLAPRVAFATFRGERIVYARSEP